MNSSIINKIAKAREYAQHAELARIRELVVEFTGTNQLHRVTYDDGAWACDCDFFRSWQTCAHAMALEQMLAPMLPAPAAEATRAS